MYALIPLVIGIIIGSIVTYLILQRIEQKKIIKLNKIIQQYQIETQENRSNNQTKITVIGEDTKNPTLVKNKNRIETITVDSTEIQNFLKSKDIQIKFIPPEQKLDEVLGSIAFFMGERYNLIKNFYSRIKSNMNYGNSFKINLKNYTQEEISSICQLGKMLHDIAFLEEYKYQKSPKYILYARPNRIPKALNFFSGQWLEYFIKEQVIRLIESINPQIQYSYLLNPQIILPDGNDFELDVLFKIKDEIFWFEAKTGDYQRYIEKYSKMSSILGLDGEHSYMILTEVQENLTKALSTIFHMKVVKAEKLAEYLQPYFEKCILLP
ncbi:MAG: hypothetical protein F6K39_35885 [Okeania sp. SIO3B3]|nr:hypothetical protein [Okeania sp. SIO3B3]